MNDLPKLPSSKDVIREASKKLKILEHQREIEEKFFQKYEEQNEYLKKFEDKLSESLYYNKLKSSHIDEKTFFKIYNLLEEFTKLDPGYAVRMICHTCESMPKCQYCDVTLTYHKKTNLLKCHYCGYAIEVPHECPTCHSTDIEMKGFGTEQVEDTLAQIFPEARIARMDTDTTRSKNAYQQIITDFEEHKTDILVGTQMVTKGLDFDRVSVVGILNADALISFPDFRAFERAFQLLSQVSGRAGRKEVPGKVIIQTYQPNHPALKYVETNDFAAMYQSQIAERQQFHLPPITRMVKITLKHPEEQTVLAAAMQLQMMLRDVFQGSVMGPAAPLVSRIQNYYLQDFWVKMSRDHTLAARKQQLAEVLRQFKLHPSFKKVRCVVTVDA